jgi:hypothetical protein
VQRIHHTLMILLSCQMDWLRPAGLVIELPCSCWSPRFRDWWIAAARAPREGERKGKDEKEFTPAGFQKGSHSSHTLVMNQSLDCNLLQGNPFFAAKIRAPRHRATALVS